MELLILLIAFMICFIGLLTVMGLSIANIEIFTDAKFTADKKAEFADYGSDGQEIYSWNYTLFSKEENIKIPFLPKDKPGMLSSDMLSFNIELNNSSYSGTNDKYIFNEFNAINGYINNFGADTPFTAYSAANLLEGKVHNFNAGENIVLFSDRRYFERQKTYSAIEKILNTSLKELDLENNHSNTAYTPAMKILEF